MLREFSQFTGRVAFRASRLTRLAAWFAALTCAAGVTAGFPRQARAEPAADFFVKLRYELVDPQLGCWDEQEFRRAVARALGYEPFRSDAAISVDVHVGGSSSLIDGRVEWKSSQGASMGERRFVAKDADCAKLLTELSFAVGLQIDLLRPSPRADVSASSGVSSRDASGEGAPPRAPSAAPSPSAAQETRAASERIRLWLGVGPALAWGVAPSLTGQGRLFFGVRRAALSLELGVLGTLPVVERQADGGGFRQYLLAGSAAFCGHRHVFSACLVGKAGALKVTGLNVDQPQSPSAFVAQAGARLAATWQLSQRWFLQPQLEGLGLLTPRSVELRHAQVWDMPTLSLAGGIDLAARFR